MLGAWHFPVSRVNSLFRCLDVNAAASGKRKCRRRRPRSKTGMVNFCLLRDVDFLGPSFLGNLKQKISPAGRMICWNHAIHGGEFGKIWQSSDCKMNFLNKNSGTKFVMTKFGMMNLHEFT